MKTFQGTKGKWNIRENFNHSDGDYLEVWTNSKTTLNNHINIVCKLHDLNYRGEIYSQTIENQKANAKLIASAPELLEALQQNLIDLKILKNIIQADYDHGNRRFEGYAEKVQEWIERSEQAINKAL